MKFEFSLFGKRNSISLERSADGYSVQLAEKRIDVRASRIDQEFIVLEIDGERYTIFIGEHDGKYSVMVRGEEYTIEKASAEAGMGAYDVEHAREGDTVTAPMPGKVIKILCKNGDSVESGQTLVIIEAMKMENNITAHRNAVVKEIKISAGDQVNLADPIIEFEHEGNEEA